MGEWIVCTNCKSVVPHYACCGNCRQKLPNYEIITSDNTSKLCILCNEVAEPDSRYCWRCKEN